jgi:hypothetical protein
LERLHVILVRGTKRIDVSAPEVPGSHPIRAPPCESLPAQFPHDDICHEPSMTTVAVREWMNTNELMAQLDSEFVRLECSAEGTARNRFLEPRRPGHPARCPSRNNDSIAKLLKREAKRAGLKVDELSGHSFDASCVIQPQETVFGNSLWSAKPAMPPELGTKRSVPSL